MSTDPDDLTAADIRRWYHEHGIPYEDEDWGPRSEVGESIGQQVQEGERTREVRSTAATPDRMWWWEKQRFPWRERSADEKRWMYLLDEFFAPYIAMMPRPKGNLLRQVFGERATFSEAGTESGMSKQGAQQATARAVRDLTRLIAHDDPLFRPERDGRRRDYEEEARSARRVFMVYVATQGITLADEEEG